MLFLSAALTTVPVGERLERTLAPADVDGVRVRRAHHHSRPLHDAAGEAGPHLQPAAPAQRQVPHVAPVRAVGDEPPLEQLGAALHTQVDLALHEAALHRVPVVVAQAARAQHRPVGGAGRAQPTEGERAVGGEGESDVLAALTLLVQQLAVGARPEAHRDLAAHVELRVEREAGADARVEVRLAARRLRRHRRRHRRRQQHWADTHTREVKLGEN